MTELLNNELFIKGVLFLTSLGFFKWIGGSILSYFETRKWFNKDQADKAWEWFLKNKKYIKKAVDIASIKFPQINKMEKYLITLNEQLKAQELPELKKEAIEGIVESIVHDDKKKIVLDTDNKIFKDNHFEIDLEKGIYKYKNKNFEIGNEGKDLIISKDGIGLKIDKTTKKFLLGIKNQFKL